MSAEEPPTLMLLRRLHSGDAGAMNELLDRNLPAVRAYVHRALGQELRQKAETMDIVQDAAAEFLRYAPRFTLASEEDFRALLCRIARSAICAQYDWFNAERRKMARERPLPEDLALDLGGSRDDHPPQVAEQHEREAWIRLALELMEPGDREVVFLREFKGLAFKDVGARLGLSEEAARKRFTRSLPRLAEIVRKLRKGRITDFL